MDAATLAARVSAGYGHAAKVIGRTTTIYRPNGAGNPIVSGNIVATLLAAFDTVPQFTFINAQKVGVTTYYALMNTTLVDVGDYLVSAAAGTYFVATQDDVAAPMVIRCNRVLTISRPGAQTPGPAYYGGDLVSTETALITAWPAAVIDKGRRQSGETHLPGDMDLPWYEILLPASVPVQLLPMDAILDDQATAARYVVSSATQMPLAWRLSARQAVA